MLFNLLKYFSAVTFLEYWKRKNASLAHHWDVLGFEEEEVCFITIMLLCCCTNFIITVICDKKDNVNHIANLFTLVYVYTHH